MRNPPPEPYPDGVTSGDEFEQIVAAALDSLPPEFLEMMDNVDVVIAEEPSPEQVGATGGREILGLYQGIPLTQRAGYAGALPDKITLFRGPLLRHARFAGGVQEQVRRTVIHEVAHHFGIDDARLEELGWA